MSVVVAMKENGIIYMGCDSQITRGESKRTMSNPSNYKIWHVDGLDQCLMGSVGLVRETNVIKVMDDILDEVAILKDEINFNYIVRNVVKKIFEEVEEHKLMCKDEDGKHTLNCVYLFSYKDKLFQIDYDGAVLEIDDYVAIGSASNEAIGSLVSTEGKAAIERIAIAIKAAAAHDLYVSYPIVIGDTTSQTYTIINYHEEYINRE